MPKPKAEESEKDFLARFMGSEEARADYPEEKQRAAVGYSLWRHRGALENAGEEWPRMYGALHMEPGLVHYADLGAIDATTGKPKGMTLLLRKPALDKMRASFVGKPVVNEVHKAVDPRDFAKGRADGIVSDAYWNADAGWDGVDVLVWDKATRKNMESGRYSVSCAYIPTDIDETAGVYHNLPYDGEILDGKYTHLAVVSNPRYEGARIIVNSGGTQMKLWFTKGSSEKVELSKDTEVEVDGKPVKLEALVNALAKEQADAAKITAVENAKLTDDAKIAVDGKDVSMSDLKNAYRKAMKNEEDEDKKKKEAAEEEKKNADAEKEAEDKKKKEDADKEKANAGGRKSFAELQKAAQTRGERVEVKPILNASDREKLGTERYGSKK